MAVINITGSNDGAAYYLDETGAWYVPRKETTGTSVDATTLEVACRKPGANYLVGRSFVDFAIAGLPAGAIITGVTLYLNGKSSGIAANYDIYAVKGTQTGTLAVSWIDDFTGFAGNSAHTPTYWSGAWNTASYSAAWNTIAFNAAGIAAVQAAIDGTLHVCLIEKQHDIDRAEMTTNSFVQFEPSTSAGVEPYLEITYMVPNIPAFTNTYRQRRQ